jgi:hypothetical protein
MNAWREVVTAGPIGSDALEVVLDPRDLGERPHRVVTVAVAGGASQCGLADATIETGPTAAGPWFAESLGSSGIATLGDGENGVLAFTSYSRFLRVSAKAAVEAEKHCDLTVYLDAEE